MTYEEVKKAVEKAILDVACDEGPIGWDEDIYNKYNFDSIDAIDVLMDIEDAVDLSIPDEDVDPLRTPHQIVDYVCQKKDVPIPSAV